MNPLSLLTKGRTIRGLKERPGAYKLLEKSILPKFTGAKSAFPTIPRQELLPPPPEREQTEAQTPAQAPAGKAAPKEQPAKPGPWSRLAGWARQRMPWSKDQPFQTPAIQTELALNKVKVIRNDLSEDDLEVVAIDKKAARREEFERERATAHT